MAQSVSIHVHISSMMVIKNGNSFLVRKINADFGTIGYVIRYNEKIEHVYDPNCREHEHLGKLAFQGAYLGIEHTITPMDLIIFLHFFRGLFYDTHLKHIRLNEKFVDFTKMNLTYLLKVKSK